MVLRLEALEDRWLPSQVGLTVSSLGDSGPGTLRAALLTADAGSQSNKFTIGFTVTGTIDLQSPLPTLNNSIDIQGPGASSLTVEPAAGASFLLPIVIVDFGQTATLSGLKVANSNTGGIGNYGTMTLANSAVVNNTIPLGTFGGGVYTYYGTMTINGCTLSGNSASEGGCIFNSGNLAVTGSTLSGNFALPPFASFLSATGGGILNTGTMTVTGCTLSGNSADYGGGIANEDGTLTVSRSTLTGNSANYQGGGIYNAFATLTVASGSTFSHNSATSGGGIYNEASSFFSSSVTMRDSVLTDNSATEGGGIYNNAFATVDMRGSTLTGNTASDFGGGLYNLGTATVQQSALSGNFAGTEGGGIFIAVSGTVTAKDSAVLHNLALIGADIYYLGALTLDDSTVGVIGP